MCIYTKYIILNCWNTFARYSDFSSFTCYLCCGVKRFVCQLLI